LIDGDGSGRKGMSRVLRSADYESEALVRRPIFSLGLNGMDLQHVLIQRR
jgi:hypothetical protein